MKSPIYYVNLTGRIQIGNSKNFRTVRINELVVKGTPDQIKNCAQAKKRFLLKHLGSNKKVKAFDLNRLILTEVEILKSLGYGVKREEEK